MIRHAVIAVGLALATSAASACPFCTTLRPTLAQQIGNSDVVLVGEVIASDGSMLKVRVHKTLKDSDATGSKDAMEIKSAGATDELPTSGTLLLAMGARKGKPPGHIIWTTIGLNEASFAYVA